MAQNALSPAALPSTKAMQVKVVLPTGEVNVPVEPNSTPGHLKENLKCAPCAFGELRVFRKSKVHEVDCSCFHENAKS